MEEPMFSVIVPATTANLGPGYDSIGLALALYMTVEVHSSAQWSVRYDEEEYADIPTDETNLIIQTIKNVANMYGKELGAYALTITSEIPLGKGLGSSATAIAAGIEIANELLSLSLLPEEKVRIGSEIEGHSDNVAAALLGGVTVAYFIDDEMEVVQLSEPNIGCVILIPPSALKTSVSRRLLPEDLPHAIASAGNAASNVMVAAMTLGDWKLAGKMMEKDVFHEQYRKSLLQDFDRIREFCHGLGAYGMTISGAGPSLFIAVEKGSEGRIARQLEEEFPFYKGIAVKPAPTGSNIKKDAH
ncbi:homoserine kinase [Sporosarcina highlanderae]|uniref:Homoserine kinase n=1 Tax=Sporosarcina highlanderae TaxID=3035916 RepID=A0ABT8JVT1_9BACL|nr:homoserine kinase [Sporosarcina highlanderae]MDN4609199.1 homoserine kinase [Sporosarcina highlanderae]